MLTKRKRDFAFAAINIFVELSEMGNMRSQ